MEEELQRKEQQITVLLKQQIQTQSTMISGPKNPKSSYLKKSTSGFGLQNDDDDEDEDNLEDNEYYLKQRIKQAEEEANEYKNKNAQQCTSIFILYIFSY